MYQNVFNAILMFNSLLWFLENPISCGLYGFATAFKLGVPDLLAIQGNLLKNLYVDMSLLLLSRSVKVLIHWPGIQHT